MLAWLFHVLEFISNHWKAGHSKANFLYRKWFHRNSIWKKITSPKFGWAVNICGHLMFAVCFLLLLLFSLFLLRVFFCYAFLLCFFFCIPFFLCFFSILLFCFFMLLFCIKSARKKPLKKATNPSEKAIKPKNEQKKNDDGRKTKVFFY